MAIANGTEGKEPAELEDNDEDLASLNAPARNTLTVPLAVPSSIPYTQTALFNLLKVMEYATNCKTYDTAWRRLLEVFLNQTVIINYLKT